MEEVQSLALTLEKYIAVCNKKKKKKKKKRRGGGGGGEGGSV